MKHSIQKYWDWMGHEASVYILIGFGLVIRAFVLLFLSRLPLASDALSYHKMALDILSGINFAPFWPPALPYFLSGFYYLFGTSEFIGRASMLVFYLGFSIAIFLLTKEIATIRAANITVLCFAIFPAFIFHSVEPLTQLPTAAYLVTAGYVILVVRGKYSWKYLVLLGIILALIVLTRASSILLAGIILMYLLVRTKDIRRFIIPLFVCTLIVSLWVIKVNHMTSRWVFVNDANSLNFFIGNNPYTPIYKTWWFGSHGAGDSEVPAAYRELLLSVRSKPYALRDRLFMQTAIEHILSRPDLFVVRTLNRIRTFFAFDTFTGSALISIYSMKKFVGLAVLFLDAFSYCLIMFLALCFFFNLQGSSGPMESVVMLLLLGLFYAFPYWISFSHPTYHFPVVPLFGIAASIIIDKWLEPGQREKRMFLIPRGTRKVYFFVACTVFLIIQVEWVSVMWSRI